MHTISVFLKSPLASLGARRGRRLASVASFGAGILLILLLVPSGMKAATWKVDTLRGKISADSATIMYIATNPDSTTVYISTQNVALDTSYHTILSLFDTSVHFQIDTTSDSLYYQIPNNGKTYWLVPFKNQYSTEHPWALSYYTGAGWGWHKCRCDGPYPKLSTCVAIHWLFPPITFCDGNCAGEGDFTCAAQTSYPKSGGLFEYDNSAMIIAANPLIYNGVSYTP